MSSPFRSRSSRPEWGEGTPKAGSNPPFVSNRDELVLAIKKELIRLGYYEGPVTSIWTKAAQASARRFIHHTGSRVPRPQPTIELLTALQAAQPIVKRKAGRPKAQLERQELPASAHPALTRKTVRNNPAATVENPQPGTTGGDYLPPWVSKKADPGPLIPSGGRADTGSAAGAHGKSARASHRAHRRRHRLARPSRGRRSYTRYREKPQWGRRSTVASAGFAWQGL
ncbi:MAG: hypothetical protein HY765_01420 [Rhodomicrobium sp.]|nr:hypothetical protein [Rhodomicrobium sp.]